MSDDASSSDTTSSCGRRCQPQVNVLADQGSDAVNTNTPYSSSSPFSSSSSSNQHIKITILSLSGVRVTSSQNKPSFEEDEEEEYNNEFSITASVSFMGSCDPDDLRVVSSSLCSTSNRLSVESRTIIVPHGMTDNLVAVWDDCPTTAMAPCDASFSSVHHGVPKGKISAMTKAHPHLYVKLKEDEKEAHPNFLHTATNGEFLIEEGSKGYNHHTHHPHQQYSKSIKSSMTATDISGITGTPTVAGTDISSAMSRDDTSTLQQDLESPSAIHQSNYQLNRTDHGPLPISPSTPQTPQSPVVLFDLQKDKQLTFDPTANTVTNNTTTLSTSTNPTNNNTSTINTPPPQQPYLQQDNIHTNNVALINTPSSECSNVPEILQMQIALHVNVLPNDQYEYDHNTANYHSVRSACLPTGDDESGGAVAHLVLFPDLLDFDSDSSSSPSQPSSPSSLVEKQTSESDNLTTSNSSNGSNIGAIREMELPVRKRQITTPTSNKFNKRASPSNHHTAHHRHGYYHGRECCDWVDLDDNAMIRIRLERCSPNDQVTFSPQVEKLDFCRKATDEDCFGDDGSIVVLSPKPSSSEESDSRTLSSNDKTPSCGDEYDDCVDQSHDIMRQGTTYNEDGVKSGCETTSQTNNQLSDSRKDEMAHNAKQCSPFSFDGFFTFLSNTVVHCGEDINGYQIDRAFSMDSTIVTDLG